MNLHGIVGAAIGAVNPRVVVRFQSSAGYEKGTSGGRRNPLYNTPVDVVAQVQDLAQRDLNHLEGLNIAGSSRKIYLFGIVNSVVRVNKLGGDLITLPILPNSPVYDGSIYLTTAVLEQWPDWCCVSVTLQNEVDP